MKSAIQNFIILSTFYLLFLGLPFAFAISERGSQSFDCLKLAASLDLTQRLG